MPGDAAPGVPFALAVADTPLVEALCPSPNHEARAGKGSPDCLILHYTGMADGPSAIRWLCEPVAKVSCHYVVNEDGGILQLVAEDRRAWHAGRSLWAGETDLNSASVGIEIVNAGHAGGLPPYPAAQVDGVVRLCRDIVGRHGIVPERVLAHSDVAPGRKQDPGERFPWQHLAAAGVGLWVPPVVGDGKDLHPLRDGDAVARLQADLADYGYGVEATGLDDSQTATVVRAFQLHFRPDRVDGIADEGTLGTLRDLLAARAALRATRPTAARSAPTARA